MRKRVGSGRERRRRQAALRLGLLMLPALFWSVVFAAVAGVRPLESAVARVPDAAQMAIALACPLLAVMLGVGALRQEVWGDDSEARVSRATVAAGVALLVFALLCALRTP
ncbi:MAG TPA: hypothetical protein VGV59_02855 [Pyrinomonadaceae bacterium]|nr:hypothetical protein [Pyrinomonadaceae bacterium]